MELQASDIIQDVQSFLNVDFFENKEKRRFRSEVLPKQICMYLLYKHAKISYNGIKDIFGYSDHTSVFFAVNKIEDERQTYKQLNIKIMALEAYLYRSNIVIVDDVDLLKLVKNKKNI